MCISRFVIGIRGVAPEDEETEEGLRLVILMPLALEEEFLAAAAEVLTDDLNLKKRERLHPRCRCRQNSHGWVPAR